MRSMAGTCQISKVWLPVREADEAPLGGANMRGAAADGLLAEGRCKLVCWNGRAADTRARKYGAVDGEVLLAKYAAPDGSLSRGGNSQSKGTANTGCKGAAVQTPK